MAAPSNFTQGITSMGIPFPGFTNGKVFFVDLANGSNSNNGLSTTRAFLTITYALSKCSSGRGDIIYVFNQNATAYTSTIAVDVDNVSIIGIPSYSSPNGAYTRISSTGVNTFTVSGDKTRIENMRLTVTGAFAGMGITGSNVPFHCVFRNIGIYLNTASGIGIQVLNTATVTRSLFENMRIEGATGVTAGQGIFAGASTTRGNIFRNLYFANLLQAIQLGASELDFVHDCYAMNCTASIGVTGATSMVANCFVDVAVSGTAKAGGNTTVS